MKYEVIDNYLDEEYFDSLVAYVTDKEKTGNFIMPWFFVSNIAHRNINEDNKLFYMIHMFYDGNVPVSPFYDKIIPLLEKLEANSLIRVKANLYPNTEILHEHPTHTDYEFSHTAAVLSLNTCDGYTGIEDEDGQITKVDSVANRVVLYDAGKNHCSSTTSDANARFNIIVNFL